MKSILVTGGAGYIGSWVTKGLLEKGYTVRITVRDKSKTEKYQHLTSIADQSSGTLEFWEANLNKKGSFDEAAEGCEGIIHIASPFIIKVKDPQRDLIDPAVNGTKYVLSAASKSGTVKKVVLTSSCASIYGNNSDMSRRGLEEFTEEHWNDSSSLNDNPYSFSKVEAEKAAWEIAKTQDSWKLVVINPSFVLGPPLTANSQSESIEQIGNLMKGKLRTGAPKLNFGVVDVREIATAHINALELDSAEGRHIVSKETRDMLEISNAIGDAYPGRYKLPKKYAPKWLMGLIGWMFGVSRRYVNENVGHPLKFNNKRSIEKLGVNYRPFGETMKDMVDAIHELNILPAKN